MSFWTNSFCRVSIAGLMGRPDLPEAGLDALVRFK
jgi:hypothetical protein